MGAVAASTAFLQFAGHYMGMEAARKAAQMQGDEYDFQAETTLLTGKWNISQIKEEGFQHSISIKEQASDKLAQLKRDGAKSLGATESTIGASGVRMDSGTAADQMIKNRLDTATQLLQNQEDLDMAITNLDRKTKGAVDTEAFNTVQKYNKLKRMADLTRSGADASQFASFMSGLASSGQTFHSMGGTDWLMSSKSTG
tara:strand:- start:1266 stop:1862 length:597 start_codon:yes stop_codon:yes gene_type:complete